MTYSPQNYNALNEDYLDLPPEFKRVWGAVDGSVLVATGHKGVLDLVPTPHQRELLASEEVQDNLPATRVVVMD